MRSPGNWIRKIGAFSVFLIVTSTLFGQQNSVTTPNFSRRIETDPKLLVEALTKDKVGEKEKFDALFSWVAINIKYDYRQYFSGNGVNSTTDIVRVLRRKKAICGEYADLMTHLCSLAGIQSVTVSGYAKDLLFDIGDTLYFSNHAWNTVELDNRWYVYDVTWSAGGYLYRYRRLAQLLLKWQDKADERRFRSKRVKLKYTLHSNKVCEAPSQHFEKEVSKTKISIFWTAIYYVLEWLPKRVVIDHGTMTNKIYYLCDPDFFAITHFPDAPFWSLTDSINTLNKFSADSAYYNYSNIVYQPHKSDGVKCLECEKHLALDSVAQWRERIALSLSNNPRNGVEPASNYLTIARFRKAEALLANDSLTKVALFDSAIANLKLGRTELLRSRPELGRYYRLHSTKNAQKVRIVKYRDRGFLKANEQLLRQVKNRTTRCSSVGKKINGAQKSYLRTNARYKSFRPGEAKEKPLTEKTTLQLQNQVAEVEKTIDSLNKHIEAQMALFLTRIELLSDEIWKYNGLISNEADLFESMANLRGYSLQDDRDKVVLDLLNETFTLRDQYRSSITNHLLLVADTFLLNFKTLTTTIRLRDAQQMKALKIYGKLCVGRIVSRDEVEHHRQRFIETTTATYCSFFQNQPYIHFFSKGFKNFRTIIRLLERSIKLDIEAEELRKKAFREEITLNKRRIRSVIKQNLKYQALQLKNVKAAKKAYLRELKAKQTAGTKG